MAENRRWILESATNKEQFLVWGIQELIKDLASGRPAAPLEPIEFIELLNEAYYRFGETEMP